MDKLGIEPDALVVAHVSHLWPLKRPLDVVLAAERALSVEPTLLGLIVGDGPLREQMEAAAAERGIGGRFRFVGVDRPRGHSPIPEPSGRRRDAVGV